MNIDGDIKPRPPAKALVYLLGALGGVAGSAAAFYQEVHHGPWLMIVLVAPAIEEICKPIGVIFMLDKRSGWLTSSSQVVVMTLLGALVFATIENLIYVLGHIDNATQLYLLWRFGICTMVHMIASGVFAVGLVKMWRHIRDQGGHFDIDICFRYYVLAVVIHAAYNSSMVLLAWSGILKF